MAVNADAASPAEMIDQDDDRTDDDLEETDATADDRADTVHDDDPSNSPPSTVPRSQLIIAGALIVVSLASLVGWLGYGSFRALRAE